MLSTLLSETESKKPGDFVEIWRDGNWNGKGRIVSLTTHGAYVMGQSPVLDDETLIWFNEWFPFDSRRCRLFKTDTLP